MKLLKKPKYYYRIIASIYILIFLWILYSAFNGLANGLFFVVLMALVSVYWIWKALKEWKENSKRN